MPGRHSVRGPVRRPRGVLLAAAGAVTTLGIAIVVLVAAGGTASWFGGPAAAGPQSSPVPTWSPTGPAVTAAPVYPGPAAATPAEAVAAAHAWATADGRFDRAAVALLDRYTGEFYGAGDVDAGYRTASLVKNFIAARMLVERQPFDAQTEQLMHRLITCSNDEAATTLWARLGRVETLDWVRQRYGITEGIEDPPAGRPQSWGLTSVSARAWATFYARVAADPVVGTWLMDKMAQATPNGCDNYYQHFGLPEASSTWRVKQGWIGSYDGHSYLHSTGFVDNDRFIAVLLTEGPTSLYQGTGAGSGRWVVTGAAQALLPGGHVPGIPSELVIP